MALDEPMQLRWTTAPGNSQIAILWDSTRGPAKMTWAPVAAGSAFLVPGDFRGMFGRVIIAGTLRVTGQAVTLTFYRRTSFTSPAAAADWELDSSAPGAGTIAVAASVTQPYEWLAKEDSLILATAGGTGPTLFYSDITVTPTQDYGT